MIRIALTKGRIENKSIELLKQAGYDCTELEEKGRKLVLKIKNADIEVVLAKAADVITYIEHGVCDVGIVGEDTIMEHGNVFHEILDLNFGKCKFALAGLKGKRLDTDYRHIVIASKYPKVTKDFFNQKGIDVEIVKIEGSVELAPILNLADAIVDIVETGTTLKENGLEVYEDVAYISTRLIVNTASIKLKKDEINEFVDRIYKHISN